MRIHKVKNKEKNNENSWKSGLIVFFPWRDALSITVAGLPLRFGEIWSALFGIEFLLSKEKKLKKSEVGILLILLLNFGIAFLGIAINSGSIDSSFATKYLIRNALTMVFLLGFLVSNIVFTEKDISFLMKYIVILEFVMFIVIETTGLHLLKGGIATWDDILSTGQYVKLGALRLPRFMGSCSEAGYLAPILVMPTYYYLKSITRGKNVSEAKRMLILTLIMAIFTFSTAVYGFQILCVLYALLDKRVTKRRLRVVLFALAYAMVGIVIVLNNPNLHGFTDSIVNKLIAYTGGSAVDYSGMTRNMNINACIELFQSGNFFEKLIGQGTGGYSYFVSHSARYAGSVISGAEEGDNLFFSTLADRGIIGLFLLFAVIFYIRKFRVKGDLFSETIFVGLMFQMLHWIITGNMWLYYFWQEVAMLVGYYRYHKWNQEIAVQGELGMDGFGSAVQN